MNARGIGDGGGVRRLIDGSVLGARAAPPERRNEAEGQAAAILSVAHAGADGVTGRLVDSLDPAAWAAELGRIAADPEAWQRLGPGAAQRARGFSWDAMANRMIAAYESL